MNVFKKISERIDPTLSFGLALLLAPPIGIYKIIQYPTTRLKKSIYIFFALAQTVALINVIFFPNDPYKLALASYQEKDYKSAIELLQLVPSNDANFNAARLKKHEIENMLYPMGRQYNQWADDEEYYYNIQRDR